MAGLADDDQAGKTQRSHVTTHQASEAIGTSLGQHVSWLPERRLRCRCSLFIHTIGKHNTVAENANRSRKGVPCCDAPPPLPRCAHETSMPSQAALLPRTSPSPYSCASYTKRCVLHAAKWPGTMLGGTSQLAYWPPSGGDIRSLKEVADTCRSLLLLRGWRQQGTAVPL